MDAQQRLDEAPAAWGCMRLLSGLPAAALRWHVSKLAMHPHMRSSQLLVSSRQCWLQLSTGVWTEAAGSVQHQQLHAPSVSFTTTGSSPTSAASFCGAASWLPMAAAAQRLGRGGRGAAAPRGAGVKQCAARDAASARCAAACACTLWA